MRSRASAARSSSGSKATTSTSSGSRARSSCACWQSASQACTALASDLVIGEDGKARCAWGASDDLYRSYHDDEWGRPVTDERGLYEKLSLECLQSGLSWALILRKREGIRDAFAAFDPDVVAGFGPPEIEELLKDARVIRNRRKLEAIVQNAQATISMRDESPLPELVWSFRQQPDAKALAKELKQRG